MECSPFGCRLEGLTEHGLIRSVIVPIVDVEVRPVGRVGTFGGRDIVEVYFIVLPHGSMLKTADPHVSPLPGVG